MAFRTDHADVVAKRRDVLSALATPTRKPELVDQLSASRSTVDRAVEELQDAGLVDQEGSSYVATYAGREALSAYESYLDRVDALTAAQPVLAPLPPTVDVDPAALQGAEVVQSTPAAPDSPLEANVDLLQSARTLRATSPFIMPRYFEALDNLVEGFGTDIELVYTREALDALESAYGDVKARLEATDGVHICVTDETIPYIVWTAEVPDGTVSGLIVHDDTGVVGVVNNETDAMNEWARSAYERYRADAEQLF